MQESFQHYVPRVAVVFYIAQFQKALVESDTFHEHLNPTRAWTFDKLLVNGASLV